MKTTWRATLCFCLAASATAAIEQADVTDGTVRGAVGNGVAAFKGIPFAALPWGICAGTRLNPSFPGAGSAFGPPTNDPLLSFERAESAATDLVRKLGATDIQAARLIPAEKVLEAVSAENGLKFWPVLDGKLLSARNVDVYRAGRFNDVPILIGFNSGESAGNAPPKTTARSFSEIGKDLPAACAPKIAAVLALYPHETDADAGGETLEQVPGRSGSGGRI